MHSTVFAQGMGVARRGTVAQSGVPEAGLGVAAGFGGAGLIAGLIVGIEAEALAVDEAGALAVGAADSASGAFIGRGGPPGAGAMRGGGIMANRMGTAT